MSYTSKFIERFDIDLTQPIFEELDNNSYSTSESFYSSSVTLSDPSIISNKQDTTIVTNATVEPITIPRKEYHHHPPIIEKTTPTTTDDTTADITLSSSQSSSQISHKYHHLLGAKFKHFLSNFSIKKKDNATSSRSSSNITSSIPRVVST
ncbi:uncharacterized protein BX663DRAFT_495423, partial [Cokeromyces recurvatus]|uniref:uncharacterized protein n=1 Tax=Cokeromyces recurvatus TaxID=90255 RepID=UPI00221EFC38